uniref:Uncharacterized protein n=1 Tax=Cyanistes caeruleus TaxID=156563 RepID=A0A8C0ZKF8_CYACU
PVQESRWDGWRKAASRTPVLPKEPPPLRLLHEFNIRLVWYLYELNGIWPFYYLLLGSVFPLLGFCLCWCKALTCSALLGASQE